MAKAIRKKPTILSPAQWAGIRARAEAGEMQSTLALQYGLHVKTVQLRAQREDWQTPNRLQAKARKAKREGVTPLSENTESSELTETGGKLVSPANQSPPNSLKAMKARLAASAGTDPQAFQAALAGLAEDLIAEGMRDLEPPRTVSEAAKLNDLVRKARALDKGPGADTAHIRPMRSLSRQPAIDVAPAPEPFEI